MASDSTLSDLGFSWEEDRKFILRSWSLVFSILATLMILSVMDGRMAYVKGPYNGYLGFWTNCRRHKCANLGQVTVLIHMSEGFMLLALGLCLLLLPAMGLSFRPFFRRLYKVDFVFSSLSIGIVNCETVHPRPRISYQVAFYMCWCASALMLWAGALCYLNQVGMWSRRITFVERRRMSQRRWAIHHFVQRCASNHRNSDINSEHILHLPNSHSIQESPQVSARNST
nr:uncharacterized protein LOC105865558 isoform X3 [Microcebus murinus]